MQNDTISWYMSLIQRFAIKNDRASNLISVICAERGWNPMQPKETIKVTFGDEHYEIKRID